MTSPRPSSPSTAERTAKNRLLFDEAGGEAWRLLVYEPVHDGRLFTNIGGRRVLDWIGRRARLGSGSHVLELCCGLGDTACYLAERFGCRVTGVDVNRRQLEAARINRDQHRCAVAHRVEFVEADVTTWHPRRGYDAVYAMDSLMYLPDRLAVTATARRALTPGGLLLLAEVLAGPALDGALRRHLWETDGVVALPTPAEQVALLEAAGFAAVELEDLTPLAVACFTAIVEANHSHRDRLLAIGAERFADAGDNEIHRDAFRRRALVYARCAAAAPR